MPSCTRHSALLRGCAGPLRPLLPPWALTALGPVQHAHIGGARPCNWRRQVHGRDGHVEPIVHAVRGQQPVVLHHVVLREPHLHRRQALKGVVPDELREVEGGIGAADAVVRAARHQAVLQVAHGQLEGRAAQRAVLPCNGARQKSEK